MSVTGFTPGPRAFAATAADQRSLIAVRAERLDGYRKADAIAEGIESDDDG
ncbi:hypothetical protein Tamer19_14030 [Cupriavidus sp. TA19]|uniref:hypothetical protein n=1 Tax=unclassified Cupriavidus TaxID=2640874 RepID=UPI000ED7B7DD|nr:MULTISPECIES: hypothetical protein [unclassified Cupriavidus]BDB25152.1 hypothetical protein CTP10_R25260 [Cupriavidus sp. P-10]GLC91995.1 hypothetical protein Tamer19_14030 [Cupriavidus sp. TA19]